MHHPEKLWVKMLTNKYMNGLMIMNGHVKPGSSYIWRSMMKAYDQLEDGFKFKLRRGQVSLFYEQWFDGDLLCQHLEEVHEMDIHLSINNVWLDNTWHWELVRTPLHAAIKHKLSNIIRRIN